MYSRYFKRLIDLLVAVTMLITLSPIILSSFIGLAISNRGIVFFRQPRPGKNSTIFKILKFKTMNDRRNDNGHLLPDAERLTNLGRFIRSSSLDELPQLFNVLKGDMSLVGPRPLLVKYLERYNLEQARRHEVKPGITGWAQVNGRNAISWEDKFKLDVWYVDNISFFTDVRILWLTVKKVIKRTDISSKTAATMEEFKGSNI